MVLGSQNLVSPICSEARVNFFSPGAASLEPAVVVDGAAAGACARALEANAAATVPIIRVAANVRSASLIIFPPWRLAAPITLTVELFRELAPFGFIFARMVGHVERDAIEQSVVALLQLVADI